MVLVIGLTAGIANAALLASESFEYTADASLEDQNGGTGWAGPWDLDVITQGGDGATIGAGSLEPPGVVGTGNHMEAVDNTGTAEHWYSRDLTTPLLDDGSTYWLSVVFQKSNDDNTSVWCGFALGENMWFGKGYDMDNLVLWDNTGGSFETDVPATDLSWLVLKIETNPVAEEQVYLWVNPDAGAEPSPVTANANVEIPLLGPETTSGADFFVLEYGGSGTANSSDFKCDEIKISTSFDDVYEEGTTEGDFEVGLKFAAVKQAPPNEGTPVTVDFVVDPNCGAGPNPDIDFLDGVGGMDRVTFSRTGNDLSTVVIRFQAIDDVIAEPPILEEVQDVLIFTTCAEEPNFVASKIVKPIVVDNDQANILFKYSSVGSSATTKWVTGPVKLWEEPGKWDVQWRKIGVLLQVPPAGDPVEIQVELQSEDIDWNPPIMDPPLTVTSEPNSLIFTAENYATPQKIKIWGNDDALLQVEGASAEGDQNYQAALVFTVIDGGGDTRYEWLELEDPEDPCSPEILVGLERTVDFNIEDNECGAFGYLAMDVGNPNAFTDPNYRDSDGNPLPDCYVDIYDVIELATKWLDCSDISDPSCESYL